jgi:hypothetical protein
MGVCRRIRPVSRRIRPDAALTLVCASFLVAEAGLRLAARSADAGGLMTALRDAAPQGYYPPPHVFDPECGYRYRPGHRGRFRRTDYDALLAINEHGLHAPSFSLEKPAGVYRVALVGDSLLAANQVPVEETWAVQLQQRLSPIDGRQVEILNFGVDGYLPWNIRKLVETRVLSFHPDVVVLWCDHERLGIGAERFRMVTKDDTIWEASDPQTLHARAARESGRAPSLRELIPRASYVARMLNHLVGKVGQSNIRRAEAQGTEKHDPADILEAMRVACARAGIPLAVFYRRHLPPPERDRCRTLGLPTWSDVGAVADFDSLSWPHDAHFDVRGNAVYAAQVAPVFQTMLKTLAADYRYAGPADHGDVPERKQAGNAYNVARWNRGSSP